MNPFLTVTGATFAKVAPVTVRNGFTQLAPHRHEETTDSSITERFHQRLELGFIAFMLLSIGQHDQDTIPLATFLKCPERAPGI